MLFRSGQCDNNYGFSNCGQCGKNDGFGSCIQCGEINRLSGCGHCGKKMVLVVVVNVMKMIGLVVWSV